MKNLWYNCDARCVFFVILSSIFILPFLWDVIMPEENNILLDKQGNIETLAKRTYAIFDEEDFYRSQLKIVHKREAYLQSEPITHSDIGMKRTELKLSYGMISNFSKGYKEPTASEVVKRLNDDEIALIIQLERKITLDELKKISSYILSKYPKINNS